MRLKLLNDEQRIVYQRYRALRHSIRSAMEKFYEEYPDAHEYPYETWVAYDRTEQSKAEYKTALTGIKQEAPKESYADRDLRIVGLVEMAEKYMLHFRSFGADPAITRELREIFKELRYETEPLSEHTEGKSMYQRLLDDVSKMPKEHKTLLLPTEDTDAPAN